VLDSLEALMKTVTPVSFSICYSVSKCHCTRFIGTSFGGCLLAKALMSVYVTVAIAHTLKKHNIFCGMKDMYIKLKLSPIGADVPVHASS
jgi:hypothetical protein